ncbi:hypothetical protein [Clostridium porci]|jgi:hypothetical protein|uniref:hypothetical protein n=1 Tax=Clostridium porci TaxID=2605778 RepID=UPI003A902DE1
MSYPYRCDSCGCYLDPGEARVCDECQQREMQRRERRRSIQESIHLIDGWQYELKLDGGYLYGKH